MDDSVSDPPRPVGAGYANPWAHPDVLQWLQTQAELDALAPLLLGPLLARGRERAALVRQGMDVGQAVVRMRALLPWWQRWQARATRGMRLDLAALVAHAAPMGMEIIGTWTLPDGRACWALSPRPRACMPA